MLHCIVLYFIIFCYCLWNYIPIVSPWFPLISVAHPWTTHRESPRFATSPQPSWRVALKPCTSRWGFGRDGHQPMGIHGNNWISIGIYGNIMEIFGIPTKIYGIMGYQRRSMDSMGISLGIPWQHLGNAHFEDVFQSIKCGVSLWESKMAMDMSHTTVLCGNYV